jgi:hypothetical protein
VKGSIQISRIELVATIQEGSLMLDNILVLVSTSFEKLKLFTPASMFASVHLSTLTCSMLNVDADSRGECSSYRSEKENKLRLKKKKL